MSHVMLDPRINKFTALENIVLKFDCARRVFAVFRVYFAIFIYGKYSDMVFQIPQTILHPLICNKSMFWAIGRVLGRSTHTWWRHDLWPLISFAAALFGKSTWSQINTMSLPNTFQVSFWVHQKLDTGHIVRSSTNCSKKSLCCFKTIHTVNLIQVLRVGVERGAQQSQIQIL